MFINRDNEEYKTPYDFPAKVSFYNLLTNHNYFQYGIECELKNANEIVFPANSSFYLTNDVGKGLVYRVDTGDGLKRQQVATHILHWLGARNIYFNIENRRRRRTVIEYHHIGHGAINLAIHSITRKETINGIPRYSIDILS